MRTILLVEHDEASAYATSKHLQQVGYEVVVATDTMGALNVLDSGRPIDFLLTDVVMPRGQPSGLAIARMTTMTNPKVKIGFMTAYRDLAIEEAEMGPILYKPIDLDLLTSTLGEAFLAHAAG